MIDNNRPRVPIFLQTVVKGILRLTRFQDTGFDPCPWKIDWYLTVAPKWGYVGSKKKGECRNIVMLREQGPILGLRRFFTMFISNITPSTNLFQNIFQNWSPNVVITLDNSANRSIISLLLILFFAAPPGFSI